MMHLAVLVFGFVCFMGSQTCTVLSLLSVTNRPVVKSPGTKCNMMSGIDSSKACPNSINKVLVLGGNGRVGSLIVADLINQGVETNVLVRDIEKAKSNSLLQGAHLIQGDVNNITDLSISCQRCQAVISVHGMSPPRFSKLSDLFFRMSRDRNHPYNVNYMSIKKLLAVMEAQNVPRLVRITGALVGQNPLNFFVSLFNLLLSFTVKWHEFAEKAIRSSGVQYTIIRPAEICDCSCVEDSNNDDETQQELYLCDQSTVKSCQLGLSSRISKFDLAALCALSIQTPQLSNVTVIAGSRRIKENKTPGFSTWNDLLARTIIRPDTMIHPSQHSFQIPTMHNVAAFLYSIVLISFLAGIGNIVYKAFSGFVAQKFRSISERFAIPIHI